MICDSFDPITSSCAPCCIVCSQRGSCGKRTESEQRENAAADAANIDDGRVEQKSDELQCSAPILTEE